MKFFNRVLASVVVVIFVFTNIAFAHKPQESLWEERQKEIQLASLPVGLNTPLPISSLTTSALKIAPNLKLSAKFAGTFVGNLPAPFFSHVNVKDVFTGSSSRRVVLVEDIHQNLEAQTHISQALLSLGEMPGRGAVTVALEGAAGAFIYDTYKLCPNPAIAKQVADSFLNTLDISGPAHAGFTSYNKEGTRGLTFWGVDDANLYRQNVAAYRNSSPLKSSVLAQITRLKSELARHKENAFDARLKSFDALVENYRAGKVPMGDYAKGMVAQGASASLTVETFLEAWAMESSLDVKQVEAERSYVLEKLVQKMSKEETDGLIQVSLGYQAGVVSFAGYHEHLKNLCAQKGIDLSKTPHFDNYIRYVLLSDGIKADQLFSDVKNLEKQVYDRLAKTDEQKQLVRQSNQLYLTQKLVDFSLTSDEWKEYKEAVIPAKRAVGEREPESRHNAYDLDSRFRGNDELRPFESFYESADARNEKMVANLLSQDSKFEVLVAGGYHTSGMTELLRKKNISYLVASPKVTKVDANSASAYLSVFDREKSTLEKIFSGEKLFVALPVDGAKVPLDDQVLNHVPDMLLSAQALVAPEHIEEFVRWVATISAEFLKGDSLGHSLRLSATPVEEKEGVRVYAGYMNQKPIRLVRTEPNAKLSIWNANPNPIRFHRFGDVTINIYEPLEETSSLIKKATIASLVVALLALSAGYLAPLLLESQHVTAPVYQVASMFPTSGSFWTVMVAVGMAAMAYNFSHWWQGNNSRDIKILREQIDVLKKTLTSTRRPAGVTDEEIQSEINKLEIEISDKSDPLGWQPPVWLIGAGTAAWALQSYFGQNATATVYQVASMFPTSVSFWAVLVAVGVAALVNSSKPPVWLDTVHAKPVEDQTTYQAFMEEELPKVQAKIEEPVAYEQLVNEQRAWRESANLKIPEVRYAVNQTIAAVNKVHRLWVAKEIKDVVIIGIDGSDLGARVWHEALRNGKYFNQAPDHEFIAPNIHFVSGISPEDVHGLGGVVDWSRTLLVPIAKSGSTPESMVMYELLKEQLRNALGEKNYGKHVLAVTGKNTDSLLFNENNQLKASGAEPFLYVLPMPDGVGDSYSVFSPAGLIYAGIAGPDIEKLLYGFKLSGEKARLPVNDPNNVAYHLAGLIHHVTARNFNNLKSKIFFLVFGAYGALAKWFSQGSNESWRKETYIQTSVEPGVGSNISLKPYLNGANDGFFILTQVDKNSNDVQIPGGKWLNKDAQNAVRAAFAKALADKGRTNVTLHMDTMNELALGEYMGTMMRIWEIVGVLYGIKPFDQPAVEDYKTATRKILEEHQAPPPVHEVKAEVESILDRWHTQNVMRPYIANTPGVTADQIETAKNEILTAYEMSRAAVSNPELIDKAFALALVLHADQPRASKGDSRPYMIHVAGVVRTLLEQYDAKNQLSETDFANAVAATWLHDVVEDGKKGRWGKARFAVLNDDLAIRSEIGALIQDVTNANVRRMVEDLSKPDYEDAALADEVVIEARYYRDLGGKSLGTQLIKAADFSFNLGDLINHPDRLFPRKFFLKRLGPVLGFLAVSKISVSAKVALVNSIRASVNENNAKNVALNDTEKAPPVLSAAQETALSLAGAKPTANKSFLNTLIHASIYGAIWAMLLEHGTDPIHFVIAAVFAFYAGFLTVQLILIGVFSIKYFRPIHPAMFSKMVRSKLVSVNKKGELDESDHFKSLPFWMQRWFKWHEYVHYKAWYLPEFFVLLTEPVTLQLASWGLTPQIFQEKTDDHPAKSIANKSFDNIYGNLMLYGLPALVLIFLATDQKASELGYLLIPGIILAIFTLPALVQFIVVGLSRGNGIDIISVDKNGNLHETNQFKRLPYWMQRWFKWHEYVHYKFSTAWWSDPLVYPTDLFTLLPALMGKTPSLWEKTTSPNSNSSTGDKVFGAFGLGVRDIPVFEQALKYKIKFGTAGWRAGYPMRGQDGKIPDEIDANYSSDNVLRLAQAIANYLLSDSKQKNIAQRIAVGYDARPNGRNFAKHIVEVLVANGIRADLIDQVTPTPVMAEATRPGQKYTLAIHETASHNPVYSNLNPDVAWQGVKVLQNGFPAGDQLTAEIAKWANDPQKNKTYKWIAYDNIPDSVSKRGVDLILTSSSRLRKAFDFESLAKTMTTYKALHPEFGVLIDSMHGATSEAAKVLSELNVVDKHFNTTPIFKAFLPKTVMDPKTGKEIIWAPDPTNTAFFPEFSAAMKPGKLGFVNDGDGDRAVVIDINGKVLTPNQLGVIMAHYLYHHLHVRGNVVRTLPSTRMLDRFARSIGAQLIETPVGSKHFAPYAEDSLIDVEESGHIFFKRGGELFADSAIAEGLLFLEIIVTTGKSLSDYYADIEKELGSLVYNRTAVDKSLVTPEFKDGLMKLRAENPSLFATALEAALGKSLLRDENGRMKPGLSYDTTDATGILVRFADDTWAMYRLSGTDGSVRIYGEETTAEKLSLQETVVQETLQKLTAPKKGGSSISVYNLGIPVFLAVSVALSSGWIGLAVGLLSLGFMGVYPFLPKKTGGMKNFQKNMATALRNIAVNELANQVKELDTKLKEKSFDGRDFEVLSYLNKAVPIERFFGDVSGPSSEEILATRLNSLNLAGMKSPEGRARALASFLVSLKIIQTYKIDQLHMELSFPEIPEGVTNVPIVVAVGERGQEGLPDDIRNLRSVLKQIKRYKEQGKEVNLVVTLHGDAALVSSYKEGIKEILRQAGCPGGLAQMDDKLKADDGSGLYSYNKILARAKDNSNSGPLDAVEAALNGGNGLTQLVSISSRPDLYTADARLLAILTLLTNIAGQWVMFTPEQWKMILDAAKQADLSA